MKIAVVVPTRNEVRTIAAVAAAADAGLAALGGDGLIINADGASDDGTGQAFLAAPTRTRKRLITIDGVPGKGRNLLAAWRLCLGEGVDAVIMLDGDMRTVQPWWIPAFLRPIASRGANFVSPLYRRNLHRAVSARNISRAFFYGWFGVDVQHPLSGNYAIAQPLLRRLAERTWTPAQLGYGVETAIVSTVLADRRGWATAQLDRCEDKADRGHRNQILHDVMAATVEAAREIAPRPGPAGPPSTAPMTFVEGTAPDATFLEANIARARDRGAALWRDYARWSDGRIGEIETAFATGRMEARTWFRLFTRALLEARGAESARTAGEYAAALTPPLSLRALTVWREIAALPAGAIDAASAAEIGVMRAEVSAAAGWSTPGKAITA